MRCEECLPLVEDYFDDELDGHTAELVGSHLSTCAACADQFRRLGREQELYLSYEADARPAPDFWDGVFARAAQEGVKDSPSGSLFNPRKMPAIFSTPRFSPSLTALLVLAAIALTAVMMSYFNRREKTQDLTAISQSAPATVPPQTPVESAAAPQTVPGGKAGINGDDRGKPQLAKNVVGRNVVILTAGNRNGAPRDANRKPAQSAVAGSPDELIRQAEQKYVAAIKILSRDATRRRSQLDTEMAARFERTLTTIDRTIADTRRAAREHPGDPVAAQYMLAAYSRKVDVLREMIGY